MINEFESKAIIEKHVKKMISDLVVQDDHDLGYVGNDVESHITSIIFHVLSYSKNVQDYCEKENVFSEGI